MPVSVKICGLSTPDAVTAAVEGGADFVGFVFFPPSPRNITASDAADLAALVPQGILKVGLVVNATDPVLDRIVFSGAVDMLQLHGTEPPRRVAEIRARYDLAVMKAINIAGRSDLETAHDYESAADMLLFDAKPPEDATRPGGNALAFDWSLVAGEEWERPWMLAGGLDARNLADAVRISGATRVDISSGVEDAPGEKNPDKIYRLLDLAAAL